MNADAQQIINNTFKPYYPSGQQAPANLIPSLIHRFHSKEGYALYPDVLPLLKQLRSSHKADGGKVVIGVVTNSDNRTADILTSMGLRVNPVHYGDNLGPQAEGFDIDFTVLSYDVGHEKPDKRIFTAAGEMLDGMLEAEKGRGELSQVDQWSKVYVGDEYDKDVVGATSAGWNAVLIDREGGGKGSSVEWLEDQQPASLVDIFQKAKAVGFSSLEKLAKWLPS